MEMREEVRRIRCGSGNCYLVSNGGDAVLVDTARTVSCLSLRIYGRKTHTFSHRLLS